MTTEELSHDGDTDATERKRAVEALTEALEAEEADEKDYRIQEALQLLALKDE